MLRRLAHLCSHPRRLVITTWTAALAGLLALSGVAGGGAFEDARTRDDGAARGNSLFLVTGGVLLQALLAGLFISGTAGARMTHIIVGAVLPYLAIVPAVTAWRRARQDVVTGGFAWGATLLLVALWVQEALGHMPFPIATIIHVPLGVLLFGLSLHLALRAGHAGG